MENTVKSKYNRFSYLNWKIVDKVADVIKE